MPDDAVQFVGVQAAERDIHRWAEELAPAVASKGQALAESVRSQVQGEVPVLTGTLAASVQLGEDPEGILVSIGDGVPYAGWIEFGGSRGRDAVPEGRYLYPTALAAEADYQSLAADVADDTARRFPWSTSSPT